MKKLSLLFLALASLVTLKAQWVDDPNSNTRIANCNKAAAEVYVSTDVATGDSYVQWHYQGENGWSPWLQRLDFNGVPQWPADGIHVTTPDFATWSPGYSMTAVNGGVVTVFRTLGPHHWAVKSTPTAPSLGANMASCSSTAKEVVAPKCCQPIITTMTTVFGPWVPTWIVPSCNISMPTARCAPRPPSKPLQKNAPMAFCCLLKTVSL